MSSRPQPQSDTETPPSTDSPNHRNPCRTRESHGESPSCNSPEPTDRILIPGANAGELRDAVTAHCTDHEYASPTCVSTSVTSEGGSNDTDFLLNPPEGEFEYIIANPLGQSSTPSRRTHGSNTATLITPRSRDAQNSRNCSSSRHFGALHPVERLCSSRR